MLASNLVLPRASRIAQSIIVVDAMPNVSSSIQPSNGNAHKHAVPQLVAAQPSGETEEVRQCRIRAVAELTCVMRNSPAVLRLGFVVVAVLTCVMRNGDGWAGHGHGPFTC